MRLELPEVRPEERTPLVEALLTLCQQLLDRAQQLEQDNQRLRDEIALVKGQKPRPDIRPSQLEQAPAPTPPPGARRPGSDKRPKNSRLAITQDVVLLAHDLPPGATLHAYEPFVVQELTLQAQVTRYWRARYALPTGGSV